MRHLLELLLYTENCGVVLHDLLHAAPDLRGGERPRRVSQLVEVVDGELARVGRERLERRRRLGDVVDSVGARPAEDHDVEQAGEA